MSAAEDERLSDIAHELLIDMVGERLRDCGGLVKAALRAAIEPVAKQRDEAVAFLRECLVRPRPEGLRRKNIEALLANIAAEGGKEETK